MCILLMLLLTKIRLIKCTLPYKYSKHLYFSTTKCLYPETVIFEIKLNYAQITMHHMNERESSESTSISISQNKYSFPRLQQLPAPGLIQR